MVRVAEGLLGLVGLGLVGFFDRQVTAGYAQNRSPRWENFILTVLGMLRLRQGGEGSAREVSVSGKCCLQTYGFVCGGGSAAYL